MEVYLIILSIVVLFAVLIASVFVLFKKSPSLAGETYKSLVKDLGENNKLTNNELRLLRSDMDKMRNDHELEKTNLRAEIDKLQEERIKDRKLIMELENRLMLLNAAGDDIPFPYWMKDNNGIVLMLNDSYEKTFLFPMGKTRSDYKGHDDYSVWPEIVAKAFIENDMLIISGKSDFFMGIEPIFLDNSDESQKFLVVKYPRYLGSTRVGVAGMAIPLRESLFPRSKMHRKFIGYMVEKGNLNEALDAVKELVDDEIKEDILSLQGRYATLILEESQGVVNKSDARLERNKITKAMLDIIRISEG